MIHSYQDKNELIEAVSTEMSRQLETVLIKRKEAKVLLSGGSTPGPIYRHFASTFRYQKDLIIGLVDERFVHPEHEHSNERLLKECFNATPVSDKQIIGMVPNADNAEENLIQARENYQPFIEHTDLIILGMGKDGHTASIFPNDPESEIASTSESKDLFRTNAPSDPKNRITCSSEMITSATTIFLVIYGSEKRDILENTSLKLPIHDLLSKRSDVHIYYSE